MTRQDYIMHLDTLRRGVLKLKEFDRKQRELNGPLVGATLLEDDRAKKTQKMFENLVTRLYEDAGVSEKVKQEKLMNGEPEQAEISFADVPADTPKEDDAKPAKGGAKSRGKKKGGAK